MRRVPRRQALFLAVAALLALVMVATGFPLEPLQLAAAEAAAEREAAEAAKAPADPTRLPQLPSESLRQDPPAIPQGDFTMPAPPSPGRAPARLVEEGTDRRGKPDGATLVRRDERTDVWDRGDGTMTAVLHHGRANWKDAYGRWHPIDTTLTPKDGRISGRSGNVKVDLSGATGTGTLVRATHDAGWELGFDMAGAAAGKTGSVERSTATYREIAPGIDLEEQVTAAGIKDRVILTRPLPEGTPATFTFPLTLKGLTAKGNEGGSIGFFDTEGTEVVRMPQGIAWDSSGDPAQGTQSTAPVAVKLVDTDKGKAVEISVAREWLDKAQYPVSIDPTITWWAGWQAGSDAYVSQTQPTSNFNGAAQIDNNAYVDKIGKPAGGGEYYSYLHYDVTPLVGHSIVGAAWWGYFYTADHFPNQFALWKAAGAWNDSTITWTNQPGHGATAILGNTTANDQWVSRVVTTWMQEWVANPATNHGITIDTQGQNHYFRMAADESFGQLTDSFIAVDFVNERPGWPSQGQLTPAHESSTMTTTPTLTSAAMTDPEGDQVYYWFRIGTDIDAEYGQVINSGWLTSPSFTVPAGSLQDGVTYYWKVFTTDIWNASSATHSSFPPNQLKVNLRLGDQPASPMDAVGPASVNLANGNVVVATSSPSFETVGGKVGLSYTYNSQAPDPNGLTGEYWNNCNSTTDFPPGQPALVRRDGAVAFWWATGSPAPGIVSADSFCARWSGFITMPRANTWCFQATRDDGVVVIVDGQVVVNSWFDQGTYTPPWGGPGECVGMDTGTHQIEVDYYDGGASAGVELWVQGPGVGPMIVPSDWLSTTPPVLPQGWTFSAGGGTSLAYTEARVGKDSIVLVDPTGGTYEYKRADAGGLAWTPPAGEDGVLVKGTENSKPVYVVHAADGLTYTFNEQGRLTRAESASDDTSKAAAQFLFGPDTGRIDQIKDPVSGRTISLTYSTPNGTNVCPAPEPPNGMLCKVAYWDGTETVLTYNSAGQLVRILDPGGEVTDVAYDASGRMSKLRDPLAADKVATNPGVLDNDTTRTLIGYDGAGRATSVTLAQPNAGATPALPRPAHSYTYPTGSVTDVHVAGLVEPHGWVRRVAFDAGGRVSYEWDTAGLMTASTWDTGDRLTTRTDPAGRRTTTVYDHAGRPTDSYGPAPATCFNGQVPNGSCTNPPVPKSTTAYDEGLYGLATAWWDNTNQAGSPKLHTTGIGYPFGYEYNDWGGAAPAGMPADNFSLRSTGDILLPATGTYSFRFFADDGVRLFLDDRVVIDAWDQAAGYTASKTFTNTVANSRHRIRVDYREKTGAASLLLLMTPPGGAEWLVPATQLFPRYGLVTSTTDPDGKKTSTEYGRPELSLPTAMVADPAGLALRTSTSYEPPLAGNRWLRRLSRTLPAGREPYAGAVFADGPHAHWRLGEAAGSLATDATGKGRTATYTAGVIPGQAGGMAGDSDKAVGFNGSGTVTLPDRGLQWALSVEAWFKTAAPGVIIGMQNTAYPATPASYVPVLYVGTDGKLRGEWWQGALTPITSATTVNNNAWHHAVLVSTGTNQTLYLDGVAAGTLAGTVNNLDMAYTQIGAGYTTGYPGVGTGWGHFSGSIDEVAIYQSSLTAAQVARHFASGKNGTVTTTSTYHPATGSVASPCGGSFVQAGLVKSTTGPTGRVQEAYYDNVGRPKATHLNADAWTCTTYDTRGRPTTVSIPAFGGEPARTVTSTYAVGGDPLTTSVADSAGTITTTVDLLGRPVATTDVWNLTTTATYDQAGRLTDTTNPQETLHTDFDANGRVSVQKLGGVTVATPSYNLTTGELTGVAYGNGTSGAITLDAATGRTKQLAWSGPGGSIATDAVTYSAGGRVKDQTIDGADAGAGVDNFVYDGAGRLTTARVPGQTHTYSFANDPGCAVANAGANTNRTSTTVNGGAATTYCYDAADRLVSTSDSRYSAPGYDGHGNTTTLGNQIMKYDGADRHVETKAGTEPTVRYVRDAADRIVERKVGGTVVARYGYSAAGDTADLTLDASGTIIERLYPLVGGVLVTKRGSGDVWSYPNIHGDVIAAATPVGAKQGSTMHYDPYGQSLGSTPDNSADDLDYGWLGQHQRPLEHEGSIATIEMGARPYLPGLGRFLEVDPVEGGSCNSYEYVCSDPANLRDLQGMFIPIAIGIVVVGTTLVVGIFAVQRATNKGVWQEKGFKRCPTKAECQTATKLLKNPEHYANKLRKTLSAAKKVQLQQKIANGSITINDLYWARSKFPFFGNLSLKDIRAICLDAYGSRYEGNK